MSEMTFCAQHPERETGLRCNRCDRYMCPACAVQTPVGYRCRECVREQEDRFFNSTSLDYALVFAVSAIGAALTQLLIGLIGGFLILAILLAIPVGGAIATLALQLSGRRRGRWSGSVAAAGVVAGSLLFALTLGGLGIRTLLLSGILAVTVYGRYRMRI
ncbi:MAG: hypothetical protein OXB89_03020 [Anaerolineaceae bacterium]|nr:hypothetical protein [Anaerolineaceae bacterium]